MNKDPHPLRGFALLVVLTDTATMMNDGFADEADTLC
jgi:hypothetical protein